MWIDFLVYLEIFVFVFDLIKYVEYELDKQEKNDFINIDKYIIFVNFVNIVCEKVREQIFWSCQGYMDY